METPYTVRKAVQGFEAYSAGLSIDEIKEQYGLANVIKMASNENPLGASPLVIKAVQDAAAQAFRYAQSGNPRLAKAIAKHHGVNEKCIVTGNGSDEVIDLLIRCRAEAGVHNVVTFKPCFSLYELQTKFCGVELRQVPLNPDFTFNWAAMRAQIDNNTALAFITTPDNPSGYCPPVAELEAFARSLPPTTLLVIDEAYMDMCGDEAAHSLLPRFVEFKNIAILRTFSKSFGLAGLRLGYGIMPEPLADYLCRVRPPFSVNILAEVAGYAALEDQNFRKLTLKTVREGRELLYSELTKLGCRVHQSWSNFLMLRLPENCTKTADQVFTALLERGIIIRQLKSYHLPEYLRISVGDMHENKALLRALAEILG